FGKETLGRRQRSLVYRIHLPAHSGIRFLLPLEAPQLQSADGRFRPVGEYCHRQRNDPPSGAGDGFCADNPAYQKIRWAEIWQDRIRSNMARPKKDVSIQVLPVLAEHV